MPDLAAIGSFAGGVAQGIPAGQDIVAKHQQIQAERDKQRKLQQVEAVGIQIAQEGLFQKDPDMALERMRDAYVSVGELDKAQQYQQQLVINKEGMQKKLAGEAWELSQLGDYEGAIDRLNKSYAKGGINTQLTYAKGLDGKPTLTGTAGGKPFAKAYTGDPLEFQADLTERIGMAFMGPEAAMKWQQEERKVQSGMAVDTARIAESEQNVAESKALLPSQIQENVAQAGAAGATGKAALINAQTAQQTAQSEAALVPYKQREAIAKTEKAERDLKIADASDLAKYVHDNPPGGVMGAMTPGLANNPQKVVDLGLAIMADNTNADIPSAASTAIDILAQATLDTRVDVDAGTVEINGSDVPIGKTAAKKLVDIIRRQKLVEE